MLHLLFLCTPAHGLVRTGSHERVADTLQGAEGLQADLNISQGVCSSLIKKYTLQNKFATENFKEENGKCECPKSSIVKGCMEHFGEKSITPTGNSECYCAVNNLGCKVKPMLAM